MEENSLIEIDFAINLYELLENNDIEYVKNEILELTNYIRSFQNDCRRIIVKVIIETCYLSSDQIQHLSQWCCHIGADFVKTSTGYGTRGASEEDIKLIKPMLYDDVQIKASGGIKTFKDAIKFVKLGVARIGASNTPAILEEADEQELKKNKFTKKTFASFFDHTCLDPEATEEDIESAVNDAIHYSCKAVCVRPEFVALAHTLVKNSSVRICAVVGFEKLREKDNGGLEFDRYNLSLEEKKAELDRLFSIIIKK